ncbi:MAG: hypothetical protein JNK72_10490 [Myxococcales bacterium]|nr:hypothetical protein [Myxococcales bacterium]
MLTNPSIRRAVFALCLTLGPSVAAAQSTPSAADRAEARSHFTAGVAAFQRQSWQSALEEFQAAYRLAPHPSVRINMANCYVELQRPIEALFHFEQYLVETPAAETPQRTAVQGHIRTLRQRIAEVTLTVTPPEARDVSISVDGTNAVPGRPIRVMPGRHALEVQANGYLPARQEFDGPAGGALTLTVTLNPEAAAAPVPTTPVAPVPAVSATPVSAAPVNAAPNATPNATPSLEPGARASAMELPPNAAPLPEPATPSQGRSPALFWTTVGVTGAAAVACGLFGALALGANDEFESAVTRVNSGQGDVAAARLEGQDAADRAARYALFSDVALGLTVLGGVASTVLFFKTDFHPRVEVAASPNAHGGTLLLGGRF